MTRLCVGLSWGSAIARITKGSCHPWPSFLGPHWSWREALAPGCACSTWLQMGHRHTADDKTAREMSAGDRTGHQPHGLAEATQGTVSGLGSPAPCQRALGGGSGMTQSHSSAACKGGCRSPSERNNIVMENKVSTHRPDGQQAFTTGDPVYNHPCAHGTRNVRSSRAES